MALVVIPKEGVRVLKWTTVLRTRGTFAEQMEILTRTNVILMSLHVRNKSSLKLSKLESVVRYIYMNTAKSCHLGVSKKPATCSLNFTMVSQVTIFYPLDACSDKNCSNNGKCVAMQGSESKCKCPKLSDCSRKIELLCGKADEKTYINHCAQKVHACRKQKPSGVLVEDYCCKFYLVFFTKRIFVLMFNQLPRNHFFGLRNTG